MGYCINTVLNAYFDLLKPKSANIPGELDETTTGYNQQGQKPQETTVDKGCLQRLLHGILQHPTGSGAGHQILIKTILLREVGPQLSGVTSKDRQGKHNYWASNCAPPHFHFSKIMSLHETVRKKQRRKWCKFQ